jgi:predicted enzyme related to lactoylglutathione lyase
MGRHARDRSRVGDTRSFEQEVSIDMRIASFRVFVRDLDRAATFFQSLLQLRITADGRAHGYVVFDGGAGLNLVVECVPHDAPADEQVLVGRFTGISFAVDDIAAECARLTAAGVVFDGAPQAQPWGGVLATFLDPAGNQFQLVQYPR